VNVGPLVVADTQATKLICCRCRSRSAAATRAILVAIVVLGLPVASTGQTASPWRVDYTSERADVSTNAVESTWITSRIQTTWSRPDEGGWLVAVERQSRYGLTDVTVSGRGYRRAGDWTFAAGAGATPAADFSFRASLEGEVSRRVVGTIVATGGYRFLSFAAADIHQVQPALTWYHARGEVEARVFVTRNVARDRTTSAVLVRTTYAANPRLEITAGASLGDRIFDVAAFESGTAESRVVFGRALVGITAHDFVDIGATAANEHPAFTYRSFTLGYRRVF